MVVGRGIAGFGAGGEVRHVREKETRSLSLKVKDSIRYAEQAALRLATKPLSCVDGVES